MQPQLSKTRIDELLGDAFMSTTLTAKWRIVGGIIMRALNGTPPSFEVAEFDEDEFSDAVSAVCEMPHLALRCERMTRTYLDADGGAIQERVKWVVFRDVEALPDHVNMGVDDHNTLIQLILAELSNPAGDPLLRNLYTRYVADKTSGQTGWFTLTPIDDIDANIEKIHAAGFEALPERDETGCPCCWGDIIVVKWRAVDVPAFRD